MMSTDVHTHLLTLSGRKKVFVEYILGQSFILYVLLDSLHLATHCVFVFASFFINAIHMGVSSEFQFPVALNGSLIRCNWTTKYSPIKCISWIYRIYLIIGYWKLDKYWWPGSFSVAGTAWGNLLWVTLQDRELIISWRLSVGDSFRKWNPKVLYIGL